MRKAVFKIAAIQDKALQKQYAESCGAEFCPDLFAYSMINQETGELMGFSQFDIGKDIGYIRSLSSRIGYSDFEAMFILGRATMNFIDLCGVHKAYFVGEVKDAALLRAVGFKETEDGRWFIDLEGFFTDHCHNHKEESK